MAISCRICFILFAHNYTVNPCFNSPCDHCGLRTSRPCQAPKGALSILRLRASIGVLYGTYASFPSMPTRVFVPNK